MPNRATRCISEIFIWSIVHLPRPDPSLAPFVSNFRRRAFSVADSRRPLSSRDPKRDSCRFLQWCLIGRFTWGSRITTWRIKVFHIEERVENSSGQSKVPKNFPFCKTFRARRAIICACKILKLTNVRDILDQFWEIQGAPR